MKKVNLYYFLVLIIFLPFQNLFEALLSANTHLSANAVFWLGHWYELMLLPVLVCCAVRCALDRNCPTTRIFKPAAVFVLYAIFSALFWAPDLGRGLEGFRFSALAIVFLIFAQMCHISDEDKETLISSYSIVAVVLALWALIERFLPLNYWQVFNLSNFGWGQFEIVQKYIQSASFINGPNQLASYLLPAVFINLHKIVKMLNSYPIIDSRGAVDGQEATVAPKHYNTIIGYLMLLLIIITAILLTFSRSAIIALFITLLVYVFFGRLHKSIKIGAAVTVITAVLIGLVFFNRYQQTFLDLVSHGASQQLHQSAYNASFNEIFHRAVAHFDQFMIGSGIGSAGPAAMKYANGLVSESWYLQIWLELGSIGLILWIWLMLSLFMVLERDSRNGGAFALLAISIVALFLHTWADNPALAITFMVLAGMQRLMPAKSCGIE